MRLSNERGNYDYLPSVPVYSGGARAHAGYTVKRVRLAGNLGITEAFTRISEIIAAEGRPIQALCGVELRSPSAISPEEFRAFNTEYVALLETYELLIDGKSPIGRTNVVPLIAGHPEKYVHAFTYTVEGQLLDDSYAVAGGAEVPESAPDQIVAKGDTSPEGVTAKVNYVVREMRERRRQLGSEASPFLTHLYTPLTLGNEHRSEIRTLAGDAEGVIDCFAAPPVNVLHFEMDISRALDGGVA